MAITSLIVANLTTASLYAASFVVEVYSDSGLTTLVGSDSCAAVSGSGGGFVQATALVVHGLTYGTTYYARAGVVAPVTGKVAWSSTDTVVMGANTVPSGAAYTATLTPAINGVHVSSTLASLPSDLSYFEAYWSTISGTPATGQVASWTGNQDGAGHLVFFAGTTPATTLYIYVRAVNTTGQKQTWTSLGSATSLAASPSSGANLVYATPDGASGAASLRALVAADIPSLPESKVTNLVTDLAAKVATSTTVNGHALSSNVVVSASDLATGTLPHAQLPTLLAADIPIMVASGTGHAAGAAPDPGATAGTTKFLREDATWVVPSGVGGAVSSLTTIGTSGPATLSSGVLNVPIYAGGGNPLSSQTVQEATFFNGSNVTSFSVTFPQALASSGNTAFMIVACDGSSVVTAPTGWTVDINKQQNTYARLMLIHKATAGETSATFTVASGATFAIYFLELAGSHALDQSATGGSANAQFVNMPAITPTAGSLMFAIVAMVPSSTITTPLLPPIMTPWKAITVTATGSGVRGFVGLISQVAATNVSTTPPLISFPAISLFSGGGLAYATFSIL